MAAATTAEAAKLAGNAAYKAGDFQEAVKQYSAAISQDASQTSFFTNRAAAFIGMGHFSDALADAEAALKLEPGLERAKQRQQSVFSSLGLVHLVAAVSEGDRAVAAGVAAAVEALPQGCFGLPSPLFPPFAPASTAVTSALDATHAAVQAAPHSPVAHTAHGALLALTGRPALAAQHAAVALKVVLDNASLWAAPSAFRDTLVPCAPTGGGMAGEGLPALWDLHHPAAPATLLALCSAAVGALPAALAAAKHVQSMAAWVEDADSAPATGPGAPLHAWGVDGGELVAALSAAQAAKEAANAQYKAGEHAAALVAYGAAADAAREALGVAPATLHTNAAAAASAGGATGRGAARRHAAAAAGGVPGMEKAWIRLLGAVDGEACPGGAAAALAVAGVAQAIAPTSVPVSEAVGRAVAGGGGDPVTHIDTDEAWGEFIASARARGVTRVLVDWFAHWCGPCKAISPYVTSLAGAYHPEVLAVAKVNGDTAQDLALQAGVRAFPTFHVYDPSTGAKVDELQGASQPELQKLAYRAAASTALVATAGPLGVTPSDSLTAALKAVGAASAHATLSAVGGVESRLREGQVAAALAKVSALA